MEVSSYPVLLCALTRLPLMGNQGDNGVDDSDDDNDDHHDDDDDDRHNDIDTGPGDDDHLRINKASTDGKLGAPR